eukprot:scaffold22614_cov53-Attheya_sp.AAC.1
MGNQEVIATTVIDAGPEPIWAFLAEANRFAEWVDATKKMRSIDPGPFGVDYVYKEYGGIYPFFAKSRWIVTTFVPCTHQIHMGDDGKVKMPLDIRVESLEDAGRSTTTQTRLTITLGLQPRWFVKPALAILWPLLMRKKAQASMNQTVANAKRLVEAEADVTEEA